MFRQLLLVCLVMAATIHCRPDKLEGHDHDHSHDHSHDHAHVEPTTTTTARPKASDVNDGGRLLALPEAQACANRNGLDI